MKFDARECVICKKLFIPKSNKQISCSTACKKQRAREMDYILASEYRSLKNDTKKYTETVKKPSNLAVYNARAREKGFASYGLYITYLFLESQKLAKSH